MTSALGLRPAVIVVFSGLEVESEVLCWRAGRLLHKGGGGEARREPEAAEKLSVESGRSLFWYRSGSQGDWTEAEAADGGESHEVVLEALWLLTLLA